MNNSLVLLLLLFFMSCGEQVNKIKTRTTLGDNIELQTLYKADQGDRQSGDVDWSVVSKRDEQRRERVYELLNLNLVQTSEDYANAAMIFQHGGDTIASGMAVKLMQKAVDLDSNRSKWLLAAAIDRDLMRREQPQIYGTQYTRSGAGEPWTMHDLDTTKISDTERIEYGVETLAEQREKLKMMNKRKLKEFLDTGNTIDDLIEYVKNASLDDSEYNLSEGGINRFGYELMGDEKIEDALKMFKLNTKLYPEGYNTYDSLGECLLKMGNIKEGILAYKKSLELNPDNTSAKKVLAEME